MYEGAARGLGGVGVVHLPILFYFSAERALQVGLLLCDLEEEGVDALGKEEGTGFWQVIWAYDAEIITLSRIDS